MDKLETQLKRLAPTLTHDESERLWSRIEMGLAPHRAPKKRGAKRKVSAIVSGLVILGLLGGSVATAYASESALPGDVLYPTKLAIEKVQIAVAPTAKKHELELAFANRRVEEVEKVLSDVEEDDATDTSAEVAIPEVSLAMNAQMNAMGEEGDAGASSTEGVMAVPMMMAMKSAALDASGTQNEDINTQDDHRRGEENAKHIVPATFARMTLQNDASSTDGTTTAKAPKRWKTLDEKKKRAVQVAIDELNRTRDSLHENGDDVESHHVSEVIQNLEALHAGSTTPDQHFIQKAKDGRIRLDAGRRRGEHSSGGSMNDQTHAQTQVQAQATTSTNTTPPVDDSLPEDQPSVTPEEQGGAVIMSDADRREAEIIREKNLERKQKLIEVRLGGRGSDSSD